MVDMTSAISVVESFHIVCVFRESDSTKDYR
jgi:hypothetical protein